MTKRLQIYGQHSSFDLLQITALGTLNFSVLYRKDFKSAAKVVKKRDCSNAEISGRPNFKLLR